jgi:hypothetical protein
VHGQARGAVGREPSGERETAAGRGELSADDDRGDADRLDEV